MTRWIRRNSKSWCCRHVADSSCDVCFVPKSTIRENVEGCNDDPKSTIGTQEQSECHNEATQHLEVSC